MNLQALLAVRNNANPFKTSINPNSHEEVTGSQAVLRIRASVARSTRPSKKITPILILLALLFSTTLSQLRLIPISSYYDPRDVDVHLREMHIYNNTDNSTTYELFATQQEFSAYKVNLSWTTAAFANNTSTKGTPASTPGYPSTATKRSSVSFNRQSQSYFAYVSDSSTMLTGKADRSTGSVKAVTQHFPLSYYHLAHELYPLDLTIISEDFGAKYRIIRLSGTGVSATGSEYITTMKSLSAKDVTAKAYTNNYRMFVAYSTGTKGESELIDYSALASDINNGHLVTNVNYITDSSLFVMYAVSDNLNPDHIYCMIRNTANTTLKVAVFNAATMSTNFTSYSAAYTSTTYNTLTRSMKFINAGTQAFMIGVPESPSDRVYLYAKKLVNFADAEHSEVMLPTVLGRNSISAGYTYDIHRIMENGKQNYYLYYQSESTFESKIVKLLVNPCMPEAPYYFSGNATCHAAGVQIDGHKQSSTIFYYEACAVSRCKTCNTNIDSCDICTPGTHQLGSTACLLCSITDCTACSADNVCSACGNGKTLNTARNTCENPQSTPSQYPRPNLSRYRRLSASEVTVEYTKFNIERKEAIVQFKESVAGLDINAFQYQLIDKINGKSYPCPLCKASRVENHYRVLKFDFVADVKMMSAQAIISIPISNTKTPQSKKTITIDDIYLTGIDYRDESVHNEDYGSYTALNTIRFIAMLLLALAGSALAFWPTNMFSWLQLWSVIGGPYVLYPDRLLRWHRDWYLLVINFGTPFSGFVDWNTTGGICTAGSSYPLIHKGCSFTENFGQNFIIILCVLLFSFMLGAVLELVGQLLERKARNEGGVGTRADGTLKNMLKFRHGITFFLQFLQSIQPSLVFFSLLQFRTHYATSKMSLGVILSTFFFVYFVGVSISTTFLSVKIWQRNKDASSATGIHSTSSEVAELVGGPLKIFSFQFKELKAATNLYALLSPAVEFTRVLLICIFIIVLPDNAEASLGLILTVELLRLTYQIVIFKSKVKLMYFILESIFSLTFVLFLILKLASLNTQITIQTRQTNIGITLTVLVMIVWFTCLAFIFIEGFETFLRLVFKPRKAAYETENGVPPEAEPPVKESNKDEIVFIEGQQFIDEHIGEEMKKAPMIDPEMDSLDEQGGVEDNRFANLKYTQVKQRFNAIQPDEGTSQL